jgi:hypothetical protein
MDNLRGLRFIGKPDERQMIMMRAVGDDVAVEAPGLAHLSLGTVSIHGVLEMAL